VTGVTIAIARYLLGVRQRSIALIGIVARSIPVLYLLMVLFSLLGQSTLVLVLILSIYFSTSVSRDIIRVIQRCEEAGLLRASVALGRRRFEIWRQHLWPLATETAVMLWPEIAIQCLGFLFALDFVGYGLPFDSPLLGEMLSQAQANYRAWWIAIPTFIAALVLFVPLAVLQQALPRAHMRMRRQHLGWGRYEAESRAWKGMPAVKT